jgi:hypothetical protein
VQMLLVSVVCVVGCRTLCWDSCMYCMCMWSERECEEQEWQHHMFADSCTGLCCMYCMCMKECGRVRD